MSFPPNLVPGFVADTTTTSGAGTLTLDDSPPTGYRSFFDAFSAGDLASGDEVTFATWDSTVSFPGNQFEIATGIWTNSGGGGTLTRATTHQPNGTPVSWPASGTRNVLIIPDGLQRRQNLGDLASAATARTNLAVPGLAVSNTFSENQIISKTDTSAAQLDLRTTASANGSGAVILRARANNSVGASVIYGDIRYTIDDNISTSEDGGLSVYLMRAGTLTKVLTIDSGGVLTNVVTGNKHDEFPSSTTTDFYQAAAPTGWTRVTTGVDGCAVRLVTGGSPGTATTAGRSDVGTATVTVATANLPAHSHGLNSHTHQLAYTVSNAAGGSTTGFRLHTDNLGTVGGADTTSGPTPTSTGNTGNGSALSLNLRVADFLLASKD